MSEDERIKRKRLHVSPRDDPELNPCLEESIESLKCLEHNQQNRNACEIYFKNYRSCSKFWNRIKSERRRQGITPHLPTTEERLNILKEHGMN